MHSHGCVTPHNSDSVYAILKHSFLDIIRLPIEAVPEKWVKYKRELMRLQAGPFNAIYTVLNSQWLQNPGTTWAVTSFRKPNLRSEVSKSQFLSTIMEAYVLHANSYTSSSCGANFGNTFTYVGIKNISRLLISTSRSPSVPFTT
jgi:hypothetical protein